MAAGGPLWGPAGEATGLVLESELGQVRVEQAELDLVLALELGPGPAPVEQVELVLVLGRVLVGQAGMVQVLEQDLELELGPAGQAERVLALGWVPVGQAELVLVLVQAELVLKQLALWLLQLREQWLLGASSPAALPSGIRGPSAGSEAESEVPVKSSGMGRPWSAAADAPPGWVSEEIILARKVFDESCKNKGEIPAMHGSMEFNLRGVLA
uniref:Uncharacterized protein n=1 Tax=Sphaerodactylus townsendi TaxID=933632 RepID=A0ACB8FTH6_9SAUR